MGYSEITTVLGWMSIIHIVVLSISSLVLIVARPLITRLHSNLTGVAEAELPKLYFNYLANYKIFLVCTSLVPYIALKLM
ncbi:DUF6868 family protein [uncultured Umboniibacter sp.]|uniref:DUF6868 family protein n=1 Tax=uncultured Umboniibacter sp. TaxID=1798917 RepID=UPI003432D644